MFRIKTKRIKEYPTIRVGLVFKDIRHPQGEYILSEYVGTKENGIALYISNEIENGVILSDRGPTRWTSDFLEENLKPGGVLKYVENR